MNFTKIGDVVPGVCTCATPPFPATGLVSSGTMNFTETGIPIATNTSLVTFPCGISSIISANVNWLDMGLSLSRTGDQVVGCGVGITIGSSQHIQL